ncbi:MAG: aminotransferase class V-fold PLP-dependent enzyme [Lactobacillus sp.]|jgi:cysteine desulfurase family protein|nr:aminotransferase class V-fold PLP-dependent enzyme [Lactobacillus sp.]
MSIDLNWAATSAQKPASVLKAVTTYLNDNHYENQNRALPGVEAMSIALDTRETLSKFFGVGDASRVLFTASATMSMNMILNGLLQPGDQVLTSDMEHNAVSRPLTLLGKKGVTTTYLPCDATGVLDTKAIVPAIGPNTKALVLTHASNVTGTIEPVAEAFRIAKSQGLITILDAAQTAGYLPIDMASLHADVVVFAGHKGLLGLPGIGGFCLAAGMAEKIQPWLVGGTGNASAANEQPDFLPDKFEPGTPNTIGILSLGAGVKALEKMGLANVHQAEQDLTAYFLKGLADLPVTVYGPNDATLMTPVVSINGEGWDPGVLGGALYEKDGIITRCGLHCAPIAHRNIGTFPGGTVRFSFGYATTRAELDQALTVLATVLKEGGK